MGETTIIGAVRSFLLTCPLMKKDKININFLPDRGMEYSIDAVPANIVLKHYTDGSSERQFVFVLSSVNDYSGNVLKNIEASGFYENFTAWLEAQTRARKLPELPVRMMAETIHAASAPYLFKTGPGFGKYQIQCRLTYLQEG